LVQNRNLKRGDKAAFDKNWKNRPEAGYIHWTKGEPKNQIQLAFRSHWNLFQEIMEGRMRGRRVLEVGCGRGSMSAYFAENGYDCTLLDSSESVIATAKTIFNNCQLNASFDVGDAMNLPYTKGSFDLVFSIGLLEHFKELTVPLAEQIRVLDQGGLFIGYIVPKYVDNIQKDYNWINDILKGFVDHKSQNSGENKETVYRSDSGSERYVDILKRLPVSDIQSFGVYPLPMISYSIEFPFTLLNDQCEKVLVKEFQKVLGKRGEETGQNPWICEEGFGQAFVVWGMKR